MDWDAALKIIGALGGVGTTVAALYRWARAQGKADALAEEATKALMAKNTEIAELKADLADTKAENQRLWSMFDALTSPREGP